MSAPGSTSPVARPSLGRTIKAVAWSFLGIRKRSASAEDMARVSPFHVIIVGIAAAMVLVLGLVALVNWVVAP